MNAREIQVRHGTRAGFLSEAVSCSWFLCVPRDNQRNCVAVVVVVVGGGGDVFDLIVPRVLRGRSQLGGRLGQPIKVPSRLHRR
jgi:hypothetical protein